MYEAHLRIIKGPTVRRKVHRWRFRDLEFWKFAGQEGNTVSVKFYRPYKWIIEEIFRNLTFSVLGLQTIGTGHIRFYGPCRRLVDLGFINSETQGTFYG